MCEYYCTLESISINKSVSQKLNLFLLDCCGCRNKEAVGVKSTVQAADWYWLPNSKWQNTQQERKGSCGQEASWDTCKLPKWFWVFFLVMKRIIVWHMWCASVGPEGWEPNWFEKADSTRSGGQEGRKPGWLVFTGMIIMLICEIWGFQSSHYEYYCSINVIPCCVPGAYLFK